MTAIAFHYGRPQLAPSIYWRRRAAALFLLAGLVLALVTTAARLGGEPHAASEPTSPRVLLVSQRIHVVAPGDTLWTIARSAQPTGDVRPLVQRLAAARHGAALQVGDRVAVPLAQEATTPGR